MIVQRWVVVGEDAWFNQEATWKVIWRNTIGHSYQDQRLQPPNAKPHTCSFFKLMFIIETLCYRVAIFANALSNWCGQWNMTIDINQYHESHHKFLLLLKLQYRPTWWVQMVEVMSITHFIFGAHKCLINEFPNMRARHLETFVRWQWNNAPKLVARDENLQQKTTKKMETQDLKRGAKEATYRQGPSLKLLQR